MTRDIKKITNVLEAYAGYYISDEKVKTSSSGGAATAFAELIIEQGGIVYGAVYSEDFHSAHYKRAIEKEDLHQFKGSKYVFVEKVVKRENKYISVYEDVVEELKKGKRVLFTGLGCDVVAMKTYVAKQNIDSFALYTIELLCDGVTNQIVHKEYVSNIERIYDSKINEFSVRYKRDGWVPLYIYGKFANGKEHIAPFYETDYGFAFSNYKKKACYECPVKDKKHMGDIMVADYWGCRPGMEEYKKLGVSLIFIQNTKGKEMLNALNKECFWTKRIDENYALHYSPRYFTSHEKNPRWDEFDSIIHNKGLREAVRKCSGVYEPKKYSEKKEIAIWGTGNCFHRLVPFIEEHYSIISVVDSDIKKWDKEVEYGYLCKNPNVLINCKDVFVLILIENTQAAFQVVNRLLDMEIQQFDHVKNWLKYF